MSLIKSLSNEILIFLIPTFVGFISCSTIQRRFIDIMSSIFTGSSLSRCVRQSTAIWKYF